MAQGLTAEGALLEINKGTSETPEWVPVLERTQLNVSKTAETIDMTSLDSEGYREFKSGLRGSSLNASGNYVPSDDAYKALKAAYDDGVPIGGVRILWRNNPGETPAKYDGDEWESAIVTDLTTDASVGDKVSLNLALTLNGKPTEKTDFDPSE